MPDTNNKKKLILIGCLFVAVFLGLLLLAYDRSQGEIQFLENDLPCANLTGTLFDSGASAKTDSNGNLNWRDAKKKDGHITVGLKDESGKSVWYGAIRVPGKATTVVIDIKTPRKIVTHKTYLRLGCLAVETAETTTALPPAQSGRLTGPAPSPQNPTP